MRAGWGASVVPELLAREALDRGELVDLTPGFSLPLELYWHCWNLESGVLDRLTAALAAAAARALVHP